MGMAGWTPFIMERECLGSLPSAVVGGTLLWICSVTGRGCHLVVFLCNSSWTVMLSIFSCAYLPLYVSLFFCSVPNSSMLLNKIKKSVHPAMFLSLEEIFSFLPFSITLTTCLSHIGFVMLIYVFIISLLQVAFLKMKMIYLFFKGTFKMPHMIFHYA